MFSDDTLAHYPLRQSLLPGAKGLRIFETLGVVDWLSRPDRCLVVCEGRGGRIYAADERFLEEAQHVIGNAHGARVVFRTPEIHTYMDLALDALVEPVMFLRTRFHMLVLMKFWPNSVSEGYGFWSKTCSRMTW